MNAEEERLRQSRFDVVTWKKWGPYISERQWGTVREDYSENGNAWDYFTHDQARSRAYRWGEDGIAGISDEKQNLCFALAFWNEADPILKERMFGLTNSEGNHGEDCKEYYFYLDSTPTHSYMKYLYKYPQCAYPYSDLVQTNRKRGRSEPEYELLDTGVFEQNRYFDIFVEYAKADAEDVLIRITAVNRGDVAAPLHLLPTLWFRNTWSWENSSPRPLLRLNEAFAIHASHHQLGDFYLYVEDAAQFLFTENETNQERIFNKPNSTPYVKDAFDNYLVHGKRDVVNPGQLGTKAAAHLYAVVPGHDQQIFQMRLSRAALRSPVGAFGTAFSAIFDARRSEADDFYNAIAAPTLTPDQRLVMRQALAGMLWSKQYYYFDLEAWLREHGYCPMAPCRNRTMRNMQWFHMLNDAVISMPDKWEYPWYAAWDLAFHTIALALVDLDFAKEQLDTMLRDMYLHPNGQIPAYEWNFGDVNPPVHAWATYFTYKVEKAKRGVGDSEYLKRNFSRLLMNFAWWLNRKDRSGRNVFEGGFLGLDNVGAFDRSAPLPSGGYLEQADGTAWMALYSQGMLSIAMELAMADPSYEPLVSRFLDHFLWIGGSMNRAGEHMDELWDEEDGFFYDVLCFPDGSAERLKVRSMVGLIPLCATATIPGELLDRFPGLKNRIASFFNRYPEIAANLHPPHQTGASGRHLLSILNEGNLRRVLQRMLDEERFLSPYGIRSLSKWHEAHPYVISVDGQEHKVAYEPAESDSNLFGGNSNWRGPVWFPVNALIIRALMVQYEYYGDTFLIECPTGSGNRMTLFEVAREISTRLTRIFLKDENSRRPVFGESKTFQTDPHWRNYLLFYEYFHGDNGAGIGASHQTGWTGLVARCIDLFAHVTSKDVLADTTADSPVARTAGLASVI
jgi:hypothetical protein